jgi:hypothetical protein
MTNPNDTVEVLVAECARAIERMTFPVSSADHVARAIIPLVAEACAKIAEDTSFGVEITEWMAMTKKDVSDRACREVAREIRQQLASLGQEERG